PAKVVFTTFLLLAASKPRFVQSSRWDEAIFLMIPGTSCLATIVLSLRDKNHSPIRSASHYPSAYGVQARKIRRDALPTTAHNAPFNRILGIVIPRRGGVTGYYKPVHESLVFL